MVTSRSLARRRDGLRVRLANGGLVAFVVVAAAAARIVRAEDGTPAPEPPDRLAELSRSLERQSHELFLALSGRPSSSEPLLLHAHNFTGAARSFAHLSLEGPRDAELLRLSLSLLRRESELLAPLLPEDDRQGSFAAIGGTMSELDALLLQGAGDARDEEAPDRPRVLLENDGWHGNLLDRFLRVKGSLEGIGLERADVVVTDAKNHVVWSQEDLVREISTHYRARPWQRGELARVRFSLRLSADSFAPGANFITLTLIDAEGREAVDTLAVGK